MNNTVTNQYRVRWIKRGPQHFAGWSAVTTTFATEAEALAAAARPFGAGVTEAQVAVRAESGGWRRIATRARKAELQRKAA